MALARSRTPVDGHRVRLVAVLAAACLVAGVGAAVPMLRTRGTTERIVILGDSVATADACSCKPFGTRLAELLRRQSKNARVATLARDGQTTTGLVDQLTSDASTIRDVAAADVVTVVVGANDFNADDAASGCAGAGTACFHRALAALPTTLNQALDRIRSLARSRTRVLVLGYWNVFLDGDVAARRGPTYEQTSDALTRQVDDVLHQSAVRAAATYVDLYAAFRADGTRNDTALLADDGDHPSAAGHQRIAQVLAGYLEVGAG